MYALNVRQEAVKLAFTAEALLLVCSWCVLRYGVADMAWNAGQESWKTMALVWTLLAVVSSVLVVTTSWWWRRRFYEDDNHSFQSLASSQLAVQPKNVAVYGSLTV